MSRRLAGAARNRLGSLSGAARAPLCAPLELYAARTFFQVYASRSIDASLARDSAAALLRGRLYTYLCAAVTAGRSACSAHESLRRRSACSAHKDQSQWRGARERGAWSAQMSDPPSSARSEASESTASTTSTTTTTSSAADVSPGTRRRRMLEALERRNVPAARKAKKRRPQRVAPAPPPRRRPPVPAPPRPQMPPAPGLAPAMAPAPRSRRRIRPRKPWLHGLRKWQIHRYYGPHKLP